MQFFRTFILSGLVLGMTLNGCKKDEDPVEPAIPVDPKTELTEGLEFISSQSFANGTLSMYASEELFAGYNTIYFLLEDEDGNLVEDYDVSIMPMMDMGMMQHSTPYTQPTSVDAEKRLKMAQVTFIMPSTAGTWEITANISGMLGNEELTFQFDVVEKTPSRMLSFVGDDDAETRVFIALVEPKMPEVGTNDYVLAVYTRENMMSHPVLSNLSIEVEPWMPSMDHGSMNNVNPVQTDDGMYRGEVNFSMTGDWEVRMIVRNAKGDVLKEGIAFEFDI